MRVSLPIIIILCFNNRVLYGFGTNIRVNQIFYLPPQILNYMLISLPLNNMFNTYVGKDICIIFAIFKFNTA